MKPDSTTYVTAVAAAKVLGVKPLDVLDLADTGALPFVVHEGRTLVSSSAVLDLAGAGQ